MPKSTASTGAIILLNPSNGYLQAAPGALEAASSKLWLYRSLMTQQTDANSGLVGPIIITRAADANPDGSPNDVDTELVTLFQVRVRTLRWRPWDPIKIESMDPFLRMIRLHTEW